MPVLTAARGDQVDAIYRESHLLWGSGLGFDDYRGLWRDLIRTDWGRRHAGFHAWVGDDGRLLSSVKLYRPQLRLRDCTARVTVIGALFTPAALRGRGHASALVEAVLSRARQRGDRLLLLFSDIGAEFYTPFGFRALPAVEQWATLRFDPQPPSRWRLRPLSEEHLPAVAAAHEDFCRTRPLAVIRDTRHWEFLRVRSRRFFERLADPSLRQREQVALDGGRFAGYLTTVEGRGEWNVREVGAVGGDVEAMAAIVRLGAASARASGLRGMYGWLPPGVTARLREWEIHERRRRRAVPMAVELDDSPALSTLDSADGAYLPFQDQF